MLNETECDTGHYTMKHVRSTFEEQRATHYHWDVSDDEVTEVLECGRCKLCGSDVVFVGI